MMFKARLRRVLSGASAAILALTMAVTTAHAATTPGVEVIDASSTVTVHVYDNNNAAPTEGGTGGEAGGNLGNAIEGATISYYEVGKLVQYTANGSTSLRYAVRADAATAFGWSVSGKPQVTISDGTDATYFLLDADELSGLLGDATSSELRGKGAGASWHDETTTRDGSAAVSGLSGLYLFVGKSMPSHVTTEVAPFLVSAPMPADGGWNDDVHVYPKVQTAEDITILKQVRYASSSDEGDFASSMSANSGTPLEYRVTVTIPGSVKNLDSLSVTDAVPAGLELVKGTVKVTTSDNVVLDSNDYELGDAGQITFSLKEGEQTGLGKFDSVTDEATITITYQAKIDDSASLAAPVTGTATLSYGFENAAAKDPVESAATVYTYGIDLTKTFGGSESYVDGAQFQLKTSDGAVVRVTGGSGVYWVDQSGSQDGMAVVQLSSSARGTLVIKGLAAGTYRLEETVAPDGYGRLQRPIEIVVSEGTSDDPTTAIEHPAATVNGADATIDAAGGERAGLAQLTVENQRLLFGFLPQTGEAGTLVATAAGVGMIALAVVFVAGRRAKASER